MFFDMDGESISEFDFSKDDASYMFESAEFNMSGDCIIVGSYDGFLVFKLGNDTHVWELCKEVKLEHYYNINNISWMCDGSKLLISNSLGCLDMYEIWLKKTVYNRKFEFTYVSKNSVVVQMISSGIKLVVKSKYAEEIVDIKIYQNRFIAARTFETLILGIKYILVLNLMIKVI